MDDERERALRQRFGPPVERGRPRRVAPRRGRLASWLRGTPRWIVVSVAGLAVLAALGGAVVALTAHDHVAPGCSWWTADTVGRVVAGQRGCLRGTFTLGGALAESADAGSPSLALDPGVRAGPGGHDCRFLPGEELVVRYHAVFDDGRTIVVVDRCA